MADTTDTSPEPQAGLSHIGEDGAARMVDVSAKPPSLRVAVARGQICMQPETLRLIRENRLAKGDVIGTARLAGIMAAKRTGDLIPLCHPLPLQHAEVEIRELPDLPGLEITATTRIFAATGVEMEALTAVSVTALTLYDMAKSADKQMIISDIMLIHKSGGRSGAFNADRAGQG